MDRKLIRYTDWRQRLIEYLGKASRQPFVEGEHDCALFLANGVRAMTGQDFAAPYRGRYTTTKCGMRILKKAGFDDHIDLAAHHLVERPVAMARAGDGAVVPTDDGPALGIVQGEGVYVLGPSGMGVVPLTTAVRAFKV